MNVNGATRVVLFTRNELMAAGVKAVFTSSGEFSVSAVCSRGAELSEWLSREGADLILVDSQAVDRLTVLHEVCSQVQRCQVVLWGSQVSAEFGSQAIELGVRGIIPWDASVAVFLEALRVVRSGQLWFTKELMESVLLATRHQLTRREGEVISLISQGLKNKQIAHSLGIGEGTVKVYLSRIFKKVGVDDRFQLALYAVRNVLNSRGAALAPPAEPDHAAAPLPGRQVLHSLVMPAGGYGLDDPPVTERAALRPITGQLI